MPRCSPAPLLLVAACTVGADAGALTVGQSASNTAGDTGGSPGSTGAPDPDSSGPPPDKLDIVSQDLPQMECASVAQTTEFVEGPSDVIIVVDADLTNADHVDPILDNFSLQVGNSQLTDLHVVMLAGYPPDGACIDPGPLGVEGCPVNDDNPPEYRHIVETIQGPTLLQQLLDTHAQWAPTMRPEAWKHLWVLTTTDASMPVDTFRAAFVALDESYERHTVHAIAPMAPPGDSCSMVEPGAPWANADAFAQLVATTGGVFENACNYNVKMLFDALLDNIESVALSCVYEIPPPPNGLVFDKGEVNVDFDDGLGPLTVGYVPDVAGCPAVGDGWYYDDDDEPTEIVMCPQTCARFEAFEVTSVEIRFGCTTIPAG